MQVEAAAMVVTGGWGLSIPGGRGLWGREWRGGGRSILVAMEAEAPQMRR